jgi:SagB-type dehydrogenase family enzyme
MAKKRSFFYVFFPYCFILWVILLLCITSISCFKSANAFQERDRNQMIPEEIIPLDPPYIEIKMPLVDAIEKRRSVRAFESKKLSMGQISLLLWASQGMTDEATGFRSVPSAGALYPLEVFFVDSEGAYQYIAQGHHLIMISSDDLRTDVMEASLSQTFIADAPVAVIICAVYERTTAKYGERGKMYVHLEAGHACQNLLLTATALGLGAVPVGAFDEEAINKTLGLPKDHTPLYIVPIGYPAP